MANNDDSELYNSTSLIDQSIVPLAGARSGYEGRRPRDRRWADTGGPWGSTLRVVRVVEPAIFLRAITVGTSRSGAEASLANYL
jgi:hypothetical protein